MCEDETQYICMSNVKKQTFRLNKIAWLMAMAVSLDLH